MKRYVTKQLILENIHNIENILNCDYLISSDSFSNTFLNKLIPDKKFKKVLEENSLNIELHSSNILIYLYKENNFNIVDKLNNISLKNEDLDYYKKFFINLYS